MATTTRIFLGIPVPLELAVELHENIRLSPLNHQKDVHWIQPSNMHITVRFIGRFEKASLKKLIATLEKEIKQKSFFIELNKIQNFPHSHSAIIALLIQPHPVLSQLFNQLQQLMIKFGLAAEKHLFKPHITLCRLKNENSIRLTPIDYESRKMAVHELILYESVLYQEESHYHPLHHFIFDPLLLRYD